MRFTFGARALRGGINLIPAIIGLFAIAEMIKQGTGLEEPGGNQTALQLKQVRFPDIWKETWKKYKGVLRALAFLTLGKNSLTFMMGGWKDFLGFNKFNSD